MKQIKLIVILFEYGANDPRGNQRAIYQRANYCNFFNEKIVIIKIMIINNFLFLSKIIFNF